MFGPSASSSSQQPLPLRLSIVGQNNNHNNHNNNNNNTPSSQKKKRKSLSLTTSITGHPSHSLDEENRLQTPINMIDNNKAFDSNLLLNESDHHNKKSPRIEQTGDTDDNTFEHIEVDISESSLGHTIEKVTSTTAISNDNMKPTRSSDCGTDLSSVSERREWLKSFEKQQTKNSFRSTNEETGSPRSQTRDNENGSHYEARDTGKGTMRQSPPHSTKTINRTNNGYSNSIPVISTSIDTVTKQRTPAVNQQRAPVINRRVSSGVTWSGINTRSGINKEAVKATDDSHASVASLSKWLASDPTSAKKLRHVRRGRNIISKSRQFEKDLENVVVMEESKIARGAVGDRKKWLQSAFRSSVEEDRGDDDASSTYSGYVQSDVDISTRSYSNSNYNRQCAQTEIITNDAASSLSVADKKDWLKEAFSKKSQERTRLGRYARAQTDVMHNRGQPRDEVASRAKMRFKERSARKLLETSSTTSLKATSTTKSKEPITNLASTSSIGRVSTNRIEPRPRGENIKINSDNTNMKIESYNTHSKESVFRPKKVVHTADSVEEDSTPVDFRAAREALVQRGKKNGHNTQVVNKVFLRKQKFEKLEEDSRRKSIGLVLKPSWDIGDPSRGGPSTVYEKKYVQDIAPKKSFEELP